MANRRGRPKVSSVETLSEAAIELFLELGFEATSIDDISMRVGVSRGTFFTYFSGGKADALWAQLLPDTGVVIPEPSGDGIRASADALIALVADWGDRVPQVLRDAAAMQATDTLVATAGPRLQAVADALALRIAADDDSLPESPHPSTAAGALTGAAVGAIIAWAREPNGSAGEALEAALAPIISAFSRS